MNPKNKLTILSLMGGRWHSLEPYIQGLINLECNPKEIQIIWFSNAQDSFIGALNMIKPQLEKLGFSVQIIHDDSLPQSANIFNEGGQRSEINLNTITSLYNAAWQYVKGNDVLFLEDDILIQSHTLKRLVSNMDKKPRAAIIGSCVFDRHVGAPGEPTTPIVFAWQVLKIHENINGKMVTSYMLAPVKQPWGLQRVNCVGFACTLIRRSRLPSKMVTNLPFKTANSDKKMKHISGCDIVFSLEVQKFSREVYCDFDVRPLHFNSRGGVH